jgi:hypothetical protein
MRFQGVSLFCCVLINLSLHSCEAWNKTKNGNSTVQTSKAPSISYKSAMAQHTIRQTDFRNFTYAWYPSYLRSKHHAELTLSNGKFEVEPTKRSPIGFLLIELDDVSYAKLLDTDDEEAAVIYLRGISGVNRFVGCILIYKLEAGSPKLLWQYETGDRADGGLRRMEIEGHGIVIEQNTLDGSEGLCCPKKFIRRYFKWDGKQFRETKSETLPIEETK